MCLFVFVMRDVSDRPQDTSSVQKNWSRSPFKSSHDVVKHAGAECSFSTAFSLCTPIPTYIFPSQASEEGPRVTHNTFLHSTATAIYSWLPILHTSMGPKLIKLKLYGTAVCSFVFSTENKTDVMGVHEVRQHTFCDTTWLYHYDIRQWLKHICALFCNILLLLIAAFVPPYDEWSKLLVWKFTPPNPFSH